MAVNSLDIDEPLMMVVNGGKFGAESDYIGRILTHWNVGSIEGSKKKGIDDLLKESAWQSDKEDTFLETISIIGK